MKRVVFHNKIGMSVVGTLFVPENANGPLPAVVIGHPFGAVKEQSSIVYARKLAAQGYVALSFDQSFWGESDGYPRQTVVPDIYVDNISAAVDFLGTQDIVDRDRIGALGICGSGGFVLAAAQIDPRLKAIATVSMYNMGDANRHGIGGSVSAEDRWATLDAAMTQRQAEYEGAAPEYTSGAPDEIDETSDPVSKEFYDFYRTPRGYSPRTTTKPTLSSNIGFMNFYPFTRLDEISPRPVMFVAGTEAHSIEFSHDAYARAAEPKELVEVPGAGHVDLYDREDLIPFDKLLSFFGKL